MTVNSTGRRHVLQGALAAAVALPAMRRIRAEGAQPSSEGPALAASGNASSAGPLKLSRFFRGEVLAPSSPGYDQVRRLVNAAVDKRPRLIARCVGAADVTDAVRYAREHGLEIAVRGGGHHISGLATTEGGLLIDSSFMRGVRIDPKTRTARVQAGVRTGELVAEASRFGLAAVTGGVGNVGIAGLTLGGGNGDISPARGFACDNLLSIDMVLADGKLITVSAEEYPDLFWAVRGAGSNFGVVTSFDLQLHPVPAPITSGMLVYDLVKGKQALHYLREFSATASEYCSIVTYLGRIPPLPAVPERLRNQVALGLNFCHTGSPELADAELDLWRKATPPDADLTGRNSSYLEFLHSMDGGFPHIRQHWDAVHFDTLSDNAISTILEQGRRMRELPLSGMHSIAFFPYRGAMGRPAAIDNAYTLRGGWEFPVMAFWSDQAEDAAQVEWVESVVTAARRFGGPAAYMNFVTRPNEQRVRAFYGAATYARLQQLKKQYDPDNVFHLNPNCVRI